MKGFELFTFCVEEKYIKDVLYVQTLNTLFMHLQDDLFPLLEKAEKENRKLSIDDSLKIEISDSYSADNVVIV